VRTVHRSRAACEHHGSRTSRAHVNHSPPESEQDPAFDRNAFVVPVERVAARLILADGSQHDVLLPRGPGQPIADVFAARESFFAAQEGGVMRLYARAALACVALDERALERVSMIEEPEDFELPEVARAVTVQLSGGVALDGELRFVPVVGRGRISDVLNEPAASFALHGGSLVYHVAKAHVLTIDER
jgi:hypothetical protein